MNKPTLVIGASNNPSRYSYQAVKRLTDKDHTVYAIGLRKGTVLGIEIQTGFPELPSIDTVTLYIRPEIQKNYYDYIVKVKPKRIIFNPGTENRELELIAEQAGIETIEGCTLVMLSIGAF